MDNYPEEFAPEIDYSGAVRTPFPEWWQRVQAHFPTVPEGVARQWLHRHWGHSPYKWLRSVDYHFRLLDWPTDRLHEIQCNFCGDWDNLRNRDHGKHLIDHLAKGDAGSWVSRYMLEHDDFPEPIIVLDNRDSHLIPGENGCPSYRVIPVGLVLVEGHIRFCLSLYLQSTEHFVTMTKVWLIARA